MRRTLLLSIGLSLLLCFRISFAKPEPLKNQEEVKHFAKGVLGSLAHVYFDGAWRQMRERTSMPIAQFDSARDRIADHMNRRVPETGTIAGDDPEFVTETAVNGNTFEVEAMLPFQKGGYRWLLRFTKSKSGWLLSYFSINGISGLEYPK